MSYDQIHPTLFCSENHLIFYAEIKIAIYDIYLWNEQNQITHKKLYSILNIKRQTGQQIC